MKETIKAALIEEVSNERDNSKELPYDEILSGTFSVSISDFNDCHKTIKEIVKEINQEMTDTTVLTSFPINTLNNAGYAYFRYMTYNAG